MMKIKVEDLVKAIEYIKRNSNDVHVRVDIDPGGRMQLRFQDKDLSEAVIKLFNEGVCMPKISKEDPL